jgi:hypothetical protein
MNWENIQSSSDLSFEIGPKVSVLAAEKLSARQNEA